MNNFNSKEYFNTISNKYNVNEYASFFITNYLRKHLVNKIKIFDDKIILDIMSGTGENIKYIKNYNNSTKIVTIDNSNGMNNEAKQRLKNKNVTQIETDFFKINYKPNSFDVIFCSFGIKTMNTHEINQFSEKITTLLNPKGEVLLLEMVRPKNRVVFKIMRFYLEECVPKIFGNEFKLLFPFINNHRDMNTLKIKLIENNLSIIEHKRIFDFFEIIHAKSIS